MGFWLLPYLFLYICLLTAGGFTDERMCRYMEKPGGGDHTQWYLVARAFP